MTKAISLLFLSLLNMCKMFILEEQISLDNISVTKKELFKNNFREIER